MLRDTTERVQLIIHAEGPHRTTHCVILLHNTVCYPAVQHNAPPRYTTHHATTLYNMARHPVIQHIVPLHCVTRRVTPPNEYTHYGAYVHAYDDANVTILLYNTARHPVVQHIVSSCRTTQRATPSCNMMCHPVV